MVSFTSEVSQNLAVGPLCARCLGALHLAQTRSVPARHGNTAVASARRSSHLRHVVIPSYKCFAAFEVTVLKLVDLLL